MNNLTKIEKPYSDNKLVFNQTTGRYELALQFLKDEFGSAYKDDHEAERRIKLNSRVVYTYINLHIANPNRFVVNFLLHRTEEGRKFLIDLLKEQQYADMQTGYNDMLYQPAISFTGQDKDRNQIRQNALCVAAEEIWQNSPAYFGVNIGYIGQLPPYYYMLAR
jgi:hypothetical protein